MSVSHRTRSSRSRDDVIPPPQRPSPSPPLAAGVILGFDESLEDEFLIRERSARACAPSTATRIERSVRDPVPLRPQPRPRTWTAIYVDDDDDEEKEGEEESMSNSGSKSLEEFMPEQGKESSDSDAEVAMSTRVPLGAKNGAFRIEDRMLMGGRGQPVDSGSAVPPVTCIAGRTRTRALERVRVSYSKYFDDDEADDAEEDESSEEEEEEEQMEGSEGADVESEALVNNQKHDVKADDETTSSEKAKDNDVESVNQRKASNSDDNSESVIRRVVSDTVKEDMPESTRSERVGSDITKLVKSESMGSQRVGSVSTEDVKSEPASERATSDSANDDISLSVNKSRKKDGREVDMKNKRDEIPILVPGSSGGKSTSQSSGPAQRTRSRLSSSSSEKWKKLGTVSSPICPDEDEHEPKVEVNSPYSNSVDRVEVPNEREKEMSKKRKMGSHNIGKAINLDSTGNVDGGQEGTSKRNVQAGPTSKRRKLPQALKDDEVFKILTETIWDDNKTLPEELTKEKSPVNGGGSEPQAEDLLPLTFSFGDEKPEPVEKTEEDELWEDYDFVLNAAMIGTYHDEEDQTDEIGEWNMESDPSIFCPKGNHQLFLDEQIGIRCRFCSFIRVHIRDIMPSWAPHFGKRSGRKATFNEDESFAFNDLHSTAIGGGQGSFIPPSGTIWALPGINTSMFPHQREAVEFMWKNLAGSINIDELKSGVQSDGTGGCAISHAPGTGKTRTAILFIQTYMKIFPACRPVIFAPCVMLQGWKKEFKKWGVDLTVLNLSDPEVSREEDDAVFKLVPKGNRSKRFARIVKLHLWAKGNSVILLTYNLFTKIVTSEGNQQDAQLKKILLEKSGLIIFDEGHIPRNENSAVFKALKEVRTPKRVILTGTPFQNNFKELHNILSLVRPMFAESKFPILSQDTRTRLFAGKGDGRFWEKNEVKDSWATLTKNITDDRSIPDDKTVEELKTIIEPFVHVYNGKILDNLPGSRECVIVLDPVPLQHKNTLDKLKEIRCMPGLENDYRNSLAAIHPFLVTFFSLSDKEKTFLDSQSLEILRLNPDDGVKTKFVIELIRLSDSLKEKVLVFCHNLEPLDMLKDQLVKLFNWTEGKEVLKMVGRDQLKHRQTSIDVFNDLSSEARVMLASTKACAEGISLVGASRVILLDVEWNPSVERQAISRAYRLGQTRFVYIYHLITYGTGEDKKYSKQTKKDLWSKLVFSPEIDFSNIKARSSRVVEEQTCKFVAEDKILAEMTGNEKLKDMFLKICYQPKESNIRHVFTTDDQNPIGDDHWTG